VRLYVIGSEGQIARSLYEAVEGNGRIVMGRSSRSELDVLQSASIKRALLSFSPDVVINPAAYTAVDKAESEANLAFSINRDGAGAVAAIAQELGIPIIHLSTDYVFDGKKSTPYVETDPVEPQSVYGRSKLAGEIAVAAACERHIILRTAWVYAPFGANFVRTMLRLGSERDRLKVVNDQIGCPTYAPDIANAIISIAQSIHSYGWRPEFAGVTHLAGPDEVTWFTFASEIMQLVKARGSPSAIIDPISTADYPTAAARPANSRLNCNRLHSLFNLRLPTLSSALKRCIDRLLGLSDKTVESLS
jgi:dTDP-4-dehydrorhamnose reductase